MRRIRVKVMSIVACCIAVVAALLYYGYEPITHQGFQAKLEAIAAQGRNEDVHAIASYLNDNRSLIGCIWLRSGGNITRSEVAFYVLSTMDNPEVFDALLPLLKSDDPDIRYSAVEALRNQKELRVVETLGAILNESQNWQVRDAAADVLGEIDRKESFPILIKALEREDDISFRASVADRSLTVMANCEPPLDSVVTVASAVQFWWSWWEKNKSYSTLDWKIRGFKKEVEGFPDLGDDNFLSSLFRAARIPNRYSASRAAVKVFMAVVPDALKPRAYRYELLECEKWYEQNKHLIVWDKESGRYRVVGEEANKKLP